MINLNVCDNSDSVKMKNPPIDTTGWTTYGPALCECINTKIALINIKGIKRPVFILELITEDGRLVIKYLNVKKLRSGNYSVQKQSDFAKLYRSAFGVNPSKRFSKSQQLLPHFNGMKFITTFEEALSTNGTKYFKAKKLEPINPIITAEWTSTGQLKGKSRGHYKTQNVKSLKRKTGEDSAKNWRKIGDDLDIKNAVKPDFYSVMHHNSIQLKDTTCNIEPLPHKALSTDSNRKISVYIHMRRKHESLGSFYDRVIDETF